MTSGEIATMRGEVLRLGAEGPQSLDEISRGFERAANLGYHHAAAVAVVTAGWKAAIATGGETSAMVNTLGTVMSNFHEPASRATADMSILMTAAAAGNVRLPDLAQNFSKVGIIASAIHMPLSDAASVYSALTRATGDASQAQVLWTGMVTHMINPTKAAITVMDELHKKTGVDLVADFKKFAAGGMSFTAVMKDVRKATHGNAQELMTMFGGLRGGIGALKLLNSGWGDYLKISDQVHHHQIDVNAGFQEMNRTVSAQLGTLKNRVTETAITIGTVLLPQLTHVVKDGLLPAATAVHTFAAAHPAATKNILDTGLAIGGTTLVLGGLRKGYEATKTAWEPVAALAARTPALFTAMPAGMELATAATGEFAVTMAGVAAPLLFLKAASDALAPTQSRFKDLTYASTKELYANRDAVEKAITGQTQFNQGQDVGQKAIARSAAALRQLEPEGRRYIAAVNAMDSNLQGFTRSQKTAFIDGMSQANASLQAGTQMVKQHYDQMRQSVISDLGTQTNESKIKWDMQKLNAIDAARSQAQQVIQHAHAQQVGAVQEATIQGDKTIQANLKERRGVLESAKQEEQDRTTVAAVTAGKLLAMGEKSAASQVLAENRAWVKRREAAKNNALETLAIERQSDTARLKAQMSMGEQSVAAAQHMEAGVKKAFDGLGTHLEANVAQTHHAVVREFTGMNTESTRQAVQWANNAIREANRMHSTIVGNSPIPDLHHEVVQHMTTMQTETTTQFNTMASNGISAAERLKAGVAAVLASLASETAAYGRAAGLAFAAGLASSAGAAAAAASAVLAAAKSHLEFHSPNQVGDDPQLWGFNAIASEALGMVRALPLVRSAAQQVIDAMDSAIRGGAPTAGFGNNLKMDPHSVQALGAGGQSDAALAQLVVAIAQWPPQFQAAGQQVIAGFGSQLTKAYSDHLSKLGAENTSFTQKLRAENASFTQQLGTEHTKYLQSIAAENTRDKDRLQSIHEKSNQQLNTFLEKHHIAIDASNQRNLLGIQQHEATVNAQRQKYIEQINSAHGKHAAAQAAAAERGLASLDAANARWVNSHGAMLGIHTKEQKAMLNEWLKNHKESLSQALAHEKQHHTEVLGKLQQNDTNHVTGITQAHTKHVNGIELAHQNHVKNLKQVFESSIAKINAGIAKASTPGAQLSAIDKSTTQAVTDSFNALKLSFVTGKGNVDQLTAAYVTATTKRNQLTEEEKQAKLAGDRAMGLFGSSLADTASKIKTLTTNALDKLTYDILNSTGSIQDDTAAYVLNKTAVDQHAAAITVARLIGDRAMGDFSTSLTALAARTSGPAKTAMDAFTYGLLTGTGDTKALGETMVSTAQADKAAVEKTNQAHLLTDRLLGNFGTSLADSSKKFTEAYTAASDQYLYDSTQVGGATQQDISNLLASSEALKAHAASVTADIDSQNRITGSYTSSVSTFTAQINGPLADANAKYAYDLHNHTGSVEADVAAIQGATVGVKALGEEAQKVAIAGMGVYDAFVANAKAAYEKARQDYLDAQQSASTSGITADALQALKQKALDLGVAFDRAGDAATNFDAQVKALADPKVAKATAAGLPPGYATAFHAGAGPNAGMQGGNTGMGQPGGAGTVGIANPGNNPGQAQGAPTGAMPGGPLGSIGVINGQTYSNGPSVTGLPYFDNVTNMFVANGGFLTSDMLNHNASMANGGGGDFNNPALPTGAYIHDGNPGSYPGGNFVDSTTGITYHSNPGQTNYLNPQGFGSVDVYGRNTGGGGPPNMGSASGSTATGVLSSTISARYGGLRRQPIGPGPGGTATQPIFVQPVSVAPQQATANAAQLTALQAQLTQLQQANTTLTATNTALVAANAAQQTQILNDQLQMAQVAELVMLSNLGIDLASVGNSDSARSMLQQLKVARLQARG